MTRRKLPMAALAAALLALGGAALAPATADAQAATLLRLRAGAPLGERLQVDSSGAFTAFGFVRDVGNTSGCAAQLNATGAGTRFMWLPCRGSLRFGRVPVGQTN
ncbi:MAG TPA: hypothetical protein VEX86_04195, partial [Longimicrobium sp.]|nr:hypothetical protein [Longimicrobium sp.]